MTGSAFSPSPLHAASAPKPLPLGILVFLVFLYLALALFAVGGLCLLDALFQGPYGMDAGGLGILTPFLVLAIVFSLRAILGIHGRKPDAPDRCKAVLVLNFVCTALFGAGSIALLLALSGWLGRDAWRILAGLVPAVAVNVAASIGFWRYLGGSRRVREAFSPGDGGPAALLATEQGPAVHTPAAMHLFTMACVLGLVAEAYYLRRILCFLWEGDLHFPPGWPGSFYVRTIGYPLLLMACLAFGLHARFTRPRTVLLRLRAVCWVWLAWHLALSLLPMVRDIQAGQYQFWDDPGYLLICLANIVCAAIFLLYFHKSREAAVWLAPVAGEAPVRQNMSGDCVQGRPVGDGQHRRSS